MSFVAYKLFGRLARRWAERLPAFKQAYLSSGLAMPYHVYLSYFIAAAVFGLPFVFALGLPFHLVFLGLPFARALAASIILALIYVVADLGFGLYLPFYLKESRRAGIEAALPYAVGYMASLAGAGVGVERLVREAAMVEGEKELARELGLIVRDIELFNVDTATALERAAERSPSISFKVFMTGLRDTFITSGDLKEYAMFMARRLLENKMNALRSISNSLALIGEIYVTMMVAAPLIMIVMMIVMSLLGGSVAGIPPLLLIFILTLVVIPVSAVSVLIMIDSVLSKV